MYWAYPPPDDGALAEDLEMTRLRMKKLAAQFPDRFQMKAKHHVKWPKRRKGSDDPLRLKARTPVSRTGTAVKAPAVSDEGQDTQPLEAVRRARAAGWSQADLAEFIGMTERTLTRRLKAPDTFSVGEYRKILQAAERKGGLYGKNGA